MGSGILKVSCGWQAETSPETRCISGGARVEEVEESERVQGRAADNAWLQRPGSIVLKFFEGRNPRLNLVKKIGQAGVEQQAWWWRLKILSHEKGE